ncbi:ABC transporter family substrate-binding protein [Streptomyces apocyni]|uniref:ABC transporter family substrate-binding protein n=1 Tax=Streptomyces apocyni TaxID=2654677 RepID=UPI0012E9EBE4|nr:ABC transporter family substrate-binding protein [Streptomyces apocyni]
MSHDGARLRSVRGGASGVRTRARRAAAFLTTGALALPALTGCGSGGESHATLVPQDIAPAARSLVADGGKVAWAVDAMPETLNTFQADADSATAHIVGAVLPSMYTMDSKGQVERNADYLEKAEVVEQEPKQVVLYQLNQEAVWSDGREIGAADFAAQWRALSGKDSAYWTARNAGYDRIEKIERGANDLEVRVTFRKPYADWRSLFSPLYPKDVMGTPDSFNDGARRKLKNTAGPFRIGKMDRKKGETTLVRNPRWWGSPAKLEKLVFRAVPPEKRAAALAAGTVDLADISTGVADRIALAVRDAGRKGPLTHGPGTDLTPAQALRSWAIANGAGAEDDAEADEKAEAEREAREKNQAAIKKYADEQRALRGFKVRKSLEPAYTQLALNGADGPLADERVRRAVARAIDRTEIAKAVLGPLGLPAEPVGSHLALAGQRAYADNSGALGEQDTAEARALLADAGWSQGGAAKDGTAGSKKESDKEEEEKEEQGKKGNEEEEEKKEKKEKEEESDKTDKTDKDSDSDSGDGRYIVGQEDGKPGSEEPEGAKENQQAQPGGAPGAYAPKGTAAPSPAGGPVTKEGKPLTLRFVLPSGPGSETLRAVGAKVSKMLERIGIRTETAKVKDASYFKDHIASGEYDLALYSWPASAFPATDARPIFAKPQPAADGSLNVEQNYTRVGTDHIDQLFEQAISELDEEAARDLVKQADARIWAAAGSIPLYQRPELVAAKPRLANAGAFGFESPRYQDIGFLKPGTKPAQGGEPAKKVDKKVDKKEGKPENG